jgi:hypothetical protein
MVGIRLPFSIMTISEYAKGISVFGFLPYVRVMSGNRHEGLPSQPIGRSTFPFVLNTNSLFISNFDYKYVKANDQRNDSY